MTANSEHPDPGSDPDIAVDDEDVPDWDDEYVDRVSDRLMFNYDLEKDRREGRFTFTLYGRMAVHNKKHFLHPSVKFAEHESTEHLFVRRAAAVERADIEALVSLGHELADSWVEADEEHFSTDFTFGVIADSIPDDVREFVSGFKDRNLLSYGFHGHYEVNLFVVAPDEADIVASESADVATAFELWESIERKEPGLWDLIKRRLQL
jgi:hypothetical protein